MADAIINPYAMMVLATKRQHFNTLSRTSKTLRTQISIPFVKRIFCIHDNDVHELAYSENTFGNISNPLPAKSFHPTIIYKEKFHTWL